MWCCLFGVLWYPTMSSIQSFAKVRGEKVDKVSTPMKITKTMLMKEIREWDGVLDRTL